ncbi:prolyl-tRNA synthetase associated domain-containing protein [Pseudoalteromonas ulvae]|uniref:Ala-tRNA(Pro) hydrolase n=1 Tax=Pseudoalteromonas ulvae TaxID=107327 RepID=A0A244CQP5_PSEDV|nr:prolyl-tRNA synthetase associated domain-containing protein [Pseudoalteromonas ulvae]OUL57509.1 Ala-tRNA(Pro) hydrolase [Pseudoalteromonas ulvae]
MQPIDLELFFEQQQFDCEKIAHPPLADCKQADALELNRPGARLKNLFLRDNYGREHFLLITRPDKQVDLKKLSNQIGKARLGFASTERLWCHLGVKPGCVSMLAVLNNSSNSVAVLLDTDIWQNNHLFQCHPFVNDRTWIVTKLQLEQIFTHSGHEVAVISVPERAL